MPSSLFRTALLATAVTVGFSLAAHASEQQALYTKSLAATCANCHGTFGKSIKDAALPPLAGMKSDYLVEQMRAFKAGTRDATVMHQIAKGYSDEQIKLMADYFASQQP